MTKQQEVIVGYQGQDGSHSHSALTAHFPTAKLRGFETFGAVLSTLTLPPGFVLLRVPLPYSLSLTGMLRHLRVSFVSCLSLVLLHLHLVEVGCLHDDRHLSSLNNYTADLSRGCLHDDRHLSRLNNDTTDSSRGCLHDDRHLSFRLIFFCLSDTLNRARACRSLTLAL
jgi:hypothetical protein